MRERREAGALPWAGHGGGEVAVVELVGVAWRGKEGSSVRGGGARGLRGCHVWRWSSRRWPVALHGGWQHRSAPVAEQAEEQGGGR